MSATVHLVRTYFTATPLACGLVVLGLAFVAVGLTGYVYVPAWTLGIGMNRIEHWHQAVLLILPWLGLVLLFFASAFMPVVVERLARGRLIRVLPGGRERLLMSAVSTAGLIALLTAAAGTLAMVSFPEVSLEAVFTRSLLVAFANFGVMYAALWVVGKARGIWLVIGSLLIIIGVTTPLGFIGLPGRIPQWTWAGLAGWVGFGVLLVLGPRLASAWRARQGSSVGACIQRIAEAARRIGPAAEYRAGNENDLLLGTTRPWGVALGQIVPIVPAAWLVSHEAVWLFCFALFTAIAGAVTSHAAARSGRLWLRRDWTRAELFRAVEAAYWRYESYSLAALLLLFAGVGIAFEFSASLMALGIALLVLGAVASFYLGLMMTRGMGGFEVALGILTMVLLMGAAVAVADPDVSVTVVIELQLVLAALAFLYRVMAKVRWNALDWTVCRSGRVARGAASAAG